MTNEQLLAKLFEAPASGDLDRVLGDFDAMIQASRKARSGAEMRVKIGGVFAFAVFILSFFAGISAPIIIAAVVAVGFWVEGMVGVALASQVELDNQLLRSLYLLTAMMRQVHGLQSVR